VSPQLYGDNNPRLFTYWTVICLIILGLCLNFLGWFFFGTMFTSAFFHAFKEEFYTMSYYSHDHTAGFEQRWFFCEVLRTSSIAAILSVETQGLRELKNLDDSLVSSQNHMALGLYIHKQFCMVFAAPSVHSFP
jgi:hypothetical protein